MRLGQSQPVLAGSTDVLDQRPARARFMIDSALYPAVLARLFGLSGLVGQKKAVAIVVRNASGRRRWSKLDEWLDGAKDDAQGVIGPEARSVPGSPLTGAIPYG